MKQTIRKIVYEIPKDRPAMLARVLGVLYFKKIKFEIEDYKDTYKIVIPEDR